MKAAMKKLVPYYRRIRSQGIPVSPLLQIHDDLLFEVPEDAVTSFLPGAADIMEHAVTLPGGIATPVDPEVGYNWGEMIPLDEWKEGRRP